MHATFATGHETQIYQFKIHENQNDIGHLSIKHNGQLADHNIMF